MLAPVLDRTTAPDNPDPIDALALVYQGGDQTALSSLLEALWPLVAPLVRNTTRRPLPPTVDAHDIEQEAVLAVARLADRWDSTLGHFGAYVRVTLPWELWRFVRQFSPGRRSATVRVHTVSDDALIRAADRLPASREDGRRWDDRLIVGEMLASLDPLARRVMVLHVLEDMTLADVAQAIGVTVAGVHRAYQRGCDTLRFGLRRDPAPEVGRLVAVLHEQAGPDGRLPGRTPTIAQTGLSEVRYARLMHQLVTLGCVVERSQRRPGRLAHPTAAATLAAIGTVHA